MSSVNEIILNLLKSMNLLESTQPTLYSFWTVRNTEKRNFVLDMVLPSVNSTKDCT